ncbi:MAG: CcmD family protein [Halobacteriales archaeon]|jgi:CcmD family protein
MYTKLLVAYGIVFLLLLGYLYYLQRRVARLETKLDRASD